MKVLCDGVETHLSYCTNIHAGDAWEDAFARLRQHLPEVRRETGYEGPLGIGLRLSKSSADALAVPATFRAFQRWLGDNDFYVYTLNGFPYGAFHGERVKEDVYKPDWTEQARLDYTCQLADLLVALSPPDHFGSISTLPGTYKDWVMNGSEASMTDNLLHAVAHLVSLEAASGTTIALALEPEPCCYLETVGETVTFFEQYLYAESAIARLAELTGLDTLAAEEALHRHLGICYDVCHSAVEYESPREAIAALEAANIPIIKIQLSSALRIDRVNEAALRQLSHFDEPVYLHQVVERRDGQLHRFNDLGRAMRAARKRLDQLADLDARLRAPLTSSAAAAVAANAWFRPLEESSEWRVHFHVPVFLEKLEHFGTTQAALRELLAMQRERALTTHLEVETYTWDVLPEALRSDSIAAAIAREIDWVWSELAAEGRHTAAQQMPLPPLAANDTFC